MKSKLKPTKLVLARFDKGGTGQRALARELGLDGTAISHWGDEIPSKHQVKVLELAKAKDVKLTHKEIIEGGYL